MKKRAPTLPPTIIDRGLSADFQGAKCDPFFARRMMHIINSSSDI